ncbi:MAG TPA: hypothetical protein VFP20_09765 [Bacteroidales bacterium]|nr:hypothetical protein [Bacteroidales bacterium]
MNKTVKNVLVLMFLLFITTANGRSAKDINSSIDYATFLSRNDLLWTKMPTGWTDGAFTGNGKTGTIFYENKDGLYFEISRTDAYDHRNGTSIYTSRYRLPNGHFTLSYSGKSVNGEMRLDLWNAEARGVIHTDKGAIRFRNFTHSLEDVIVLEVNLEGNERFDLKWNPDTIQTSRPAERGKPGTAPYPMPTTKMVDGTFVSIQTMPESELYNTNGMGEGQMATAWKVVENGQGHYLVFISENYSYPGTDAADKALNSVKEAAGQDILSFENTHREWWHNFYKKSFISIPNSRLESFYWIQMYKMASATRGDGPMIDLAGPWYKPGTPWPGIWWNLNVQCTYAPFPFANHSEEGSSLINWLWKYRKNLEKNAYGEGRYAIGRSCPITLEREIRTSNDEAGNLGWALFNVWEQYRCSMDDQMLRDKLYPLIKGHYLFYMKYYVEKLADGKFHLKNSSSPEYTKADYPAPPDCNYNLSIFKWMLRAMLYTNDRLKLNDPLLAEVKTVFSNLTDYPSDPQEGFMIGKDQKFSYSHRHWSHLMMIYPFYEYTYDNKAQGEQIDRSLNHWLSDPAAFRGYSWFSAASMKAMNAEGDSAVAYIIRSLDHPRFPTRPNTFYIEAGPVIETPLLAARTIQDLMLTSYNNVIRVFPALPKSWEEASFHSMRAEGAFLVSAKRQYGQTSFVRVESLAGEPCRVKTGLSGVVKAYGSRKYKLTSEGNGVTGIDLKKGEWVVFYSGKLPDLSIKPVAVTDPINYWGTITKSTKNSEKNNI